MEPSFRSPMLDASTLTRPLAGIKEAWTQALLRRLPADSARLMRLQQVMSLAEWETTRKSLHGELERVEQQLTRLSNAERGEDQTEHARAIQLGMWQQEQARLRSELHRLDGLETVVQERHAIQVTRPEGCVCLGLGGLDTPVYLAGSTPMYGDYCLACPEGLAAQDAAAWVNEALDQEEETEERRRQQQTHQKRTRTLLAQAGVDYRYRGYTFDTFRTFLQEQGAWTEAIADELALREESYRHGEPERGDFLWGEPGHGKTSTGTCCLRAWVERGRAGLFVRASDYTDTIKEMMAKRNGSLDEYRLRVRQVSLLILDDLGMTSMTEVDRRELSVLLYARHAAGKRKITIITSNYPPAEVAARLAADNDVERDRLAGRITEMCDVLHLETRHLRRGREEVAV